MTPESSLLSRARQLRDENNWGNKCIAAALGISRQQAERLLNKLKLEDAAKGASSTAVTILPPATGLSHYDAARHALAIAKSLDEVMEIADKATAIKEYARRAKDRQLQIDATEIVMRSERRLGEMLAATPKNTGAKGIGTSAVPRENHTLAEMGIDKKLSSRAQKLASISERAIEARIKTWREGAERGADRVTTDLMRTGNKKERRAARERDIGEKIAGGNLALPTKRYGVILADPEWKFETWSANGMDRAADNHYATSETEKIAARPIADIAAKDCVLFLWATAPMLTHALHVMAAWGFTYKSHGIWDKEIAGTGYWFRNQHEVLLVGTRGNIPAPAMGTQPSSVFREARGEHSVKPKAFHELIERWFPSVPKIELNARAVRPGWDAWGAEAPAAEAAE